MKVSLLVPFRKMRHERDPRYLFPVVFHRPLKFFLSFPCCSSFVLPSYLQWFEVRMNLLNIFSKAKGKTNGKYESDAVKIEASQSLVYHGSHGHQVSVILFLLVSYTPNLSVVFITPTHTLYLLYELIPCFSSTAQFCVST